MSWGEGASFPALPNALELLPKAAGEREQVSKEGTLSLQGPSAPTLHGAGLLAGNRAECRSAGTQDHGTECSKPKAAEESHAMNTENLG